MKGTEHKESVDIHCIRDFINLGEKPEAALAKLAHENTRIVSLTITEKGYYCDVNTGELYVDNPEIQHDLKNPSAPKSSVGLICSALQERRKKGIPPFTVLSCDNLPGNGHITENAVGQFAELLDPELKAYIDAEMEFPNCMVDRITPQTKSADDPIVSEEFAQWVVEDKFVNGRPYWELLDNVLLVEDVIPYEKMKVRMLNGSHSALSYLSYLAGHRDVDQALSSPDIHDFVKLYLNEVASTVPKVPGIDLSWYQKVLLERFSNPNIKDQVQRLAEDGSSKLKTTMIPVIKEKAKARKPMPMISLAVAGWIRYMAGVDDFGDEIKLNDPLQERLQPLARDAMSTRDVRPFVEAAFGTEVANISSFTSNVQAWYVRMLTEGVWRVLDSLDEFAFGFAEFGTEDVTENPFSSMALSDMVQFSKEDLEEFFQTYDKDESGYLDVEELSVLIKDYVEKISQSLSSADLYEILGVEEDKVRESDLVESIMEALPDTQDQKAAELLLARLDIDGDGQVSLEEFVTRFNEIVHLRYQALRRGAPGTSEVTTALTLPPVSFGKSWGNFESWVRSSTKN